MKKCKKEAYPSKPRNVPTSSRSFFMMTCILEPMALSTNSKGSRVCPALAFVGVAMVIEKGFLKIIGKKR